MTANESDDDFAVGYKKPPTHTRFAKGQSGNPRGREKSLRNLRTDVVRTLGAPVNVSDEGKTKRVSTQEAALLRLREKALKGDARALDRLLHLAQQFNPSAAADPAVSSPLSGEDQKILDAYIEEVRARPSNRRLSGEGEADATE